MRDDYIWMCYLIMLLNGLSVLKFKNPFDIIALIIMLVYILKTDYTFTKED